MDKIEFGFSSRYCGEEEPAVSQVVCTSHMHERHTKIKKCTACDGLRVDTYMLEDVLTHLTVKQTLSISR